MTHGPERPGKAYFAENHHIRRQRDILARRQKRCGDGKICQSEILVIIRSPSGVILDDSNVDMAGVQTDVSIRSTAGEGAVITLQVLDDSGVELSTVDGETDADGNITFTDVDLPAGAAALRASVDAGECGSDEDEVALTVDRAELLLKLGQREAAAADYRRVLALQPGHSGALAALSRLCLELGRIEELERIQRTRLASDPLNVSSYRGLFSGYSAAGRDEEAGHALQALAVLRATNEAEAKRIAFSQAPNPKAVLSDAEFSESLLMPELRGPLATLFSKLGKVLLRQVPDDLKQHGIGWRTPRHGLEGRVFPEHPLLKQVCTVLGIRELDVYWMPEHRNPQPVLAHGKVLSLILCPQVFQGLDEPQ